MGRSENNTVVVKEDETVGRRHFQIYPEGREYWLVDLGSRNGTRLNGVRIGQPCRLRPGDIIQAGSQSFEFVLDADLKTRQRTDTPRTHPHNETFASWLLIGDLKGFTALSNTLPVDALAKKVDDWLLHCKQVVEARDGRVNKFLGDAFLAYWRDHDNAARKVIATLRALEQFQRESQLPFRLVAHHGTIMVGATGALHEEGLHGKEVVFVTRMEKLAGALGKDVLLSEAAADRLAPLRPTALVGKHELKGFDQAFAFFAFKE